MKMLILIRGLSGSGKTALAELLVGDATDRGEVSADDFFTNNKGEYNFDHLKLKEAHSWCQEETKEMMIDELKTIVVHNSFTRKWEVEPYFKLAEEHGYEVSVISIYDGGLNDKELSERGIHGLSQRQIAEQRKRWDLNVHPHRTNRPRHPQTNMMPPQWGHPMMYGYPPPPQHYPPQQQRQHRHPRHEEGRVKDNRWSKSDKGY